MESFQCSSFRNNQSSLSCKCIVFECYLYTFPSAFGDQIFEGKRSFWLVLYRHCGNNALFLASLSFMFVFFLTSFNTIDCYYFKSNLRLVWCSLLTCFLQKSCNLFLYSIKRQEIPFLVDKFFILSFKRSKILVNRKLLG